MKSFLLAIMLFCATFSFGQGVSDKIERLKTGLKATTSDSVSIKLMGDLCWYYGTIDMDSAFHYGNKALELSKRTTNENGVSQSYNDLGILYFNIGEYQEAMDSYRKSLAIRKKRNDSTGIASSFSKIGLLYQNSYKMDSAIYYNTEALKIYIATKNVRNATTIRNNIANIYRNLKMYDRALKEHKDVVAYLESVDEPLLLTRSYNNLANTHLYLKDTVQAKTYYDKAVVLASKNNFEKELGGLHNNIGSIFEARKQFDAAKSNYKKSLGYRENVGDLLGIASTTINLATSYLKTEALEQVEPLLRRSLSIGEKLDAQEILRGSYSQFAAYYALKRNADSTLHYQDLFRQINDSILGERITKEIAEVQGKYDASEREKEILSQRAQIAEKEIEVNKKNNLVYGSFGLATLLGLLGFLFYNQQKLKNRQLKKEGELKQALALIETQNKLQEQRLRISRDLHDNIGSQLTFVTSSVDNLKYGLKDADTKITNKLGNISAFTTQTIYELRDTIWAMNKTEISFEDLQVRISNFIDNAGTAAENVSFNFNVSENIQKDKTFPSVVGMNIYRIIQEALNNALKYANATTISVEILLDNTGKEVVTIIDDGKGFDVQNSRLGNGLSNMKKRAKDIEATLSIDSENSKGTTIVLNL